MFIYNVTVKVDHSIAADWLQWLLNEHIPEILATGCFKDAKVLQLLEQDDEEGLKERGFLGFLANTFIVKSENKPGKNARIPDASFTRDTSKSFFALIWKTLLSGLLPAVGAPESLAKPNTD